MNCFNKYCLVLEVIGTIMRYKLPSFNVLFAKFYSVNHDRIYVWDYLKSDLENTDQNDRSVRFCEKKCSS